MGDSYRDALRKSRKKKKNTSVPRDPEREAAIRWATVRKEHARVARKRVLEGVQAAAAGQQRLM